MSADHYRPTLPQRISEAWASLRRPHEDHEFLKGDVLLVLDAIEAYADLYDDARIEAIRRAVQCANDRRVPVVFTRWTRTWDEQWKLGGDAVDRKGHWTFYVPNGKTLVLEKLRDVAHAQCDVRFPNALTNAEVKAIVTESDRVVLAGGWVESCITSTAHSVLELDKDVVVLSNATVGHAPASHLQLYILGETACELRAV